MKDLNIHKRKKNYLKTKKLKSYDFSSFITAVNKMYGYPTNTNFGYPPQQTTTGYGYGQTYTTTTTTTTTSPITGWVSLFFFIYLSLTYL